MEPNSTTESRQAKTSSSCLPVRLLVTTMGMLGGVVMFSGRMNLSVAILAMVNETAVISLSYDNSSNSTTEVDEVVGIPLHKRGTFIWSPSTQGLILGAYFYGYSALQPVTGYMVDKFDAAKLVSCGMLLSGVLTMLTPLAADFDVRLLFVVRLLIGAFQGPYFTSIYVMYIRWTTRTERASALAANVVPAICFALIPLVGKNTTAVYALLIGSMFGYGFTCGGENPIVGEFAPAYAGHIFGIANTISSATGIVAPIFVGFLLEATMDPKSSTVQLVEPKSSSSCFPVRLIVSIMGLLGGLVMYSVRMNLSVAILAMVNETAVEGPAFENTTEFQLDAYEIDGIPLHKRGTFIWSPSTQGLILGAYFYGYSITQPFTGYMVEKSDAAKLVSYGMLISGILTVVTPWASELHVYLLVAIRLLIGACHGPYFTCIYVMYIPWVTRTERASALGGMLIGTNLGVCLTLPLTAFLCEFGFSGGYPSAFYVTGLVTIIWSLIWHFYVTSEPETHKTISTVELKYIKDNTDPPPNLQGQPVPWKSIASSVPVWTSLLVKTAQNFGYMMIQTKLPGYLEGVLDVPLHINGYINSAIFVAICVSMAISGPLADYMYKKRCMSLLNIRKLFQAVSNLIPAVCLALIPLVNKHPTSIYALLIGAMFGFGFTCGGENPIVGEFAPAYAGHIFGIVNTVAAATGIVAPMMVGYLLEITDVDNAWYISFHFSAFLYVFGAVFFCIFATVEQQSWAKPNNLNPNNNNRKDSA
ncbi:putative inorganic phosphate cotransporter [Halotydeus destructor]|nr:putative inorganic phosphate cotransporter [Halotydeus destructor]